MANFFHFWPFLAQKIRFLDIFFESAHQIWLKLGQKLAKIALIQGMAVLCLGKFLFWLFWPFLGQKYIACGDIIWFNMTLNGLLSLYLRNRASDFDDFSQMLDVIALNDLTSVLCTKKF